MRHGHALQVLARETGKRSWLLLLQHSAAGGCAAVRLAGQEVLRGGRRGEVLVRVVLQVAEGILCLLVHALVQLLPHRLVFCEGSCGSSFANTVYSVSPGSLCACNASRLASARTRLVWIVATCSSDSLCACKVAARCLPRRVPARVCHPAHPSAVC